jgi:hypothetical protein
MRGRLFFPRLKLDSYIKFLVDTGADATCLHPPDSTNMVVPYGDLEKPQDLEGIGGNAPYSYEPGLLLLADHRLTRGFRIEIAILNIDALDIKDEDDIPQIPSLLGRDILQNGWLRFDPPNGRVEFTVKRADLTSRAGLDDDIPFY